MGNLTAKGVEKLREAGRYGDGDGLYLQIGPTGTKSWLVFFHWHGKRREMGAGAFPAVSLAEARAAAQEAHRQVRHGIDPIEAKRRPQGALFGDLADRFIAERVEQFQNLAHRGQWKRSLTVYAKALRHVPVAAVTVEDVLKVLRPLWLTHWPTAKKLRIHIAQVLDYGRALGMRSGANPAAWIDNLSAVLPARPDQEEHWRAMAWGDVPEFVGKLQERDAVAARLVEFTILTACRSFEARGLTFSEIDRDERLWILPARRSKTRTEHRVPLSSRAMEIIEERAFETDGADDSLVFASPRGNIFSDQAGPQLMRRMGVGDVTLHGFRSAFSDWAHESTDHAHEVIEQSLQHAVGTAVSRAYRRTDVLEKRRALADAWAKFCLSKKHAEIYANV